MNKNIKLLSFTYNNELNIKVNIEEIFNKESLPYTFSKCKNKDDYNKTMQTWLNDRISLDNNWNVRGISKSELKEIQDEIIKKVPALSLSDQYWINNDTSSLKWSDINYFDNDFEYISFTSTSSKNLKTASIPADYIYSPNITTKGQVSKSWIIGKDSVRCLLKAANTSFKTEPINEYIAYKISKIIGLNCTPYNIDVLKDTKNDTKTLVSSCPCFINTNTELVHASEIIDFNKYNNLKDIFKGYINILKDNGIKDAKEQLEKMILLDSLLLNTDRHLNNFGIIRDVNTLKWLSVSPIYDNGRTFLTAYNGNLALDIKEKKYDNFRICREFSYDVKVNDLLELLSKDINLKEEDFLSIKPLFVEYKTLLEKYSNYTLLTFTIGQDYVLESIKYNYNKIYEYLKKNNLFS